MNSLTLTTESCSTSLPIKWPSESVLGHMLTFLDFQDIISASHTCKCLNLASQKNQVWKPILEQLSLNTEFQKDLSLKEIAINSLKIISRWKKKQYQTLKLKYLNPRYLYHPFGSIFYKGDWLHLLQNGTASISAKNDQIFLCYRNKIEIWDPWSQQKLHFATPKVNHQDIFLRYIHFDGELVVCFDRLSHNRVNKKFYIFNKNGELLVNFEIVDPNGEIRGNRYFFAVKNDANLTNKILVIRTSQGIHSLLLDFDMLKANPRIQLNDLLLNKEYSRIDTYENGVYTFKYVDKKIIVTKFNSIVWEIPITGFFDGIIFPKEKNGCLFAIKYNVDSEVNHYHIYDIRTREFLDKIICSSYQEFFSLRFSSITYLDTGNNEYQLVVRDYSKYNKGINLRSTMVNLARLIHRFFLALLKAFLYFFKRK